jgi:site-specific DNA recombinase
MHGNRSKGLNNKHYKYYVCTCKRPGIAGKEKCSMPNINGEILEKKIWDKLKVWIINPKLLFETISQDNNVEELKLEKQTIKENIVSLNEEKNRLDILFMKGKISEDKYDKFEGEIVKSLNDLSFRLEVITKELNLKDIKFDDFNKIFEMFKDIDLDNISDDEKKKIINIFVYKIIIYGKDEYKIQGFIPQEKLDSSHHTLESSDQCLTFTVK